MQSCFRIVTYISHFKDKPRYFSKTAQLFAKAAGLLPALLPSLSCFLLFSIFFAPPPYYFYINGTVFLPL